MILLLTVVLLPAAWALAQYGGNGDRGGDRGDRDQGRNRMKVEGCLFGEPGNLALTDDQGNTFELKGRIASRLNGAVGHRVRVEGETWFDRDNPNAMSSNGEATPILHVSEIERVQGRCDQWGGSPDEFRFSIPIH